MLRGERHRKIKEFRFYSYENVPSDSYLQRPNEKSCQLKIQQ